MSYNRKAYYYVDKVTNNVAQYKLQNCIVTFLDKYKNASPEKLQLRLFTVFSTEKLYDCRVLR